MFEKEAEEEINKVHWNYLIFKDLAQEYWQKGAEFGYNKAKEEMQEQGLALQSDMDKTIEQNIALKEQIEKLIDFTMERTECCDVCPITDTCINSEGTCPYAGILAKGEEAVTRKWLMRKIAKEIKEK